MPSPGGTWQWHLFFECKSIGGASAFRPNMTVATFSRGACLTPALLGAIDRHGARQPRDHVELEPQLEMQVIFTSPKSKGVRRIGTQTYGTYVRSGCPER
jgi:hypothetical protein